MKSLYTTEVTAIGGRDGKLVSSDGYLDVEVKSPKELGGPGGATNPEQLFAGGYAACFESALNVVCRAEKVKVERTEVKAQVTLGKDDGDNFALAVQLEIKLAGIERELAQKLVDKAHQVCPYSRATRGNIEVELKLS